MKLSVENETGSLKRVVLGKAESFGPQLDINPVSKMHMLNGTYPTEEDLIFELESFAIALTNAGVEVLRPEVLQDIEQIYSRDIAFVIGDKFFISNMKEPVRKKELPGIQYIIDEIDPQQIVRIPDHITVEGGDVILHNEYVFVGISSRTNTDAVNFLQEQLPNKQVVGLELVTSADPNVHVLHLDCIFQPVGKDSVIIYEEGFKEIPQILDNLFPAEKRIKVSKEEKALMFPNIFSISPEKAVVEQGFERLIKELNSRGIQTIPVPFKESSKLSGLLRCATLPLLRA